jgi:hypothetical protein
MRRLGETLDDVLGRFRLTAAANEFRAVDAWREVAGPVLARVSRPQSLRGGVLRVRVLSSAWCQELSFQRDVVLHRYRERLGAGVVRDLRFEVGALGPETPDRPAAPEAEIRAAPVSETDRAVIEQAVQGADPEMAAALRRALQRTAQLRAWNLSHGARECPRCGAAFRGGGACCPACRRDGEG